MKLSLRSQPTTSARNLLSILVSHINTGSVIANNPQTFIGYKQVHDDLGLSQYGSTYGESLKAQGLSDLAEWTKANGHPSISGLIIDRKTLLPGNGYFDYFRGTEDYEWWASEIQKSIDFDWQPYLDGVPPAPTVVASDFNEPPMRELCTSYRILRDTALALRVKQLHNYKCQLCEHTIELPNGSWYAEAHHIQPLGEPHGGPDVIGNILCLCPNHHAELDYGVIPLSMSGLHQVPEHQIDSTFIVYHNTHISRMKPTKLITTVIDMAREIEIARPVYPKELDLTDITSEMLKPTQEESQLRDFLSSQPVALIYGILQVMYLGRGDFDGDRDFLGIYSDMSDTFTKPEFAISQMLEKNTLAEYLSNGLEKAKENKVDLDQFLSK